MKPKALRQFRQKLRSGEPALGMWITLESASIVEMAVGLGLDWILIDVEHGHLDWRDVVEHVRATVRSDTVALVRVTELNGGLIKRALDVGADGVMIPWIETAEQARQAVAFAHYPPAGVRGIGAERATAWGQAIAEHVANANDSVLVIPLVETVRGGQNIDAIARVDGVDVVYLGPADYSASAGYAGQWEGPGCAEQLLEIEDAVRRAGKHCGVMTGGPDNFRLRREQNFTMLGLGADAGLLLRSLHESLAAAGRDRKLAADLSAPSGAPSPAPLPRPPEALRPDRPEIMSHAGAGPQTEISPGVSFECFVGKHNQARQLTTGVVTFAPGAVLPLHTHTFSESVTLLSGEGEMQVRDRVYKLSPLDNVTLPPGLAHEVRNLSRDKPATFHIAMNTDSPSRTIIDEKFSRQQMPESATGQAGAERVTRYRTAPRSVAGPGTQFIDYFNSELMPGLAMSGGYGAFTPGGRLPAHFHDFDESICIIEGTATCNVEGRRHALSDCATALVPRGRVHYFIHESTGPMAMIWVYAGPMPERIVVNERCATVEGDPWR